MGDFFKGAAGGILGGAISTISNLFTANAQKKENARQRQFAHDEAVLAHERQVELQNSQNQWNSFENQVQLAKAAGLNPKRIFDTGASGIARSTGSTSGSQASAPSVGSMPGLMDANAISGLISAFSQANLNNATAKKTEEDTKKSQLEQKGLQIQNNLQSLLFDLEQKYGEKYKKLGLDDIAAGIDVKKATITVQESVAALNNYDLQYIRPQQLGDLIADITLKNSQTELNRIAQITNEQERYLAALRFFTIELPLTSAEILNLQASANASNASAHLSFTMADTQRNLYDPNWYPMYDDDDEETRNPFLRGLFADADDKESKAAYNKRTLKKAAKAMRKYYQNYIQHLDWMNEEQKVFMAKATYQLYDILNTLSGGNYPIPLSLRPAAAPVVTPK